MRQSDPEQQLSIHHRGGGSSIARISRIGGALQALTLDGQQMIVEPDGDFSKVFFGSVLAPWPNRLANGEFEYLGASHRVGVLDDQKNANHGLLFTQELRVVEHHDDSLTLEHDFGPANGYPWQLTMSLSYSILEDELLVQARVQNHSAEPAPFAIGFHPYFLSGKSFELTGDFKGRVITDDRMLPIGTEEISGLRFSGGDLDHCFFGSKTVALVSELGSLEVELGDNLDHFMFYRPGPDLGDLIAIEPMSSGANAFNLDIENNLLQPNETKNFSFVIRKR